MHTKTVALAPGYRQTLLIKSHRTIAGIGQLDHQGRGAHYLAANFTLRMGQCHVRVDCVIQRIGENNRQFTFLHRQGIGKSERCMDGNTGLLSLI